jgi:putative acetyltransferase
LSERPAFRGHIRLYRPDDVDALIDIFRASVRQVARRDYSEEQVLAWAPDAIDRTGWVEQYASRPAWVAEIEDRPVGFSDLEPDGHLDMMFVHPDHQGRGVASALLAEVESAARHQGIDCLHTEASITARPFFERRGFQLLAPQTVSLRGQRFINYRMEKVLGLPCRPAVTGSLRAASPAAGETRNSPARVAPGRRAGR